MRSENRKTKRNIYDRQHNGVGLVRFRHKNEEILGVGKDCGLSTWLGIVALKLHKCRVQRLLAE